MAENAGHQDLSFAHSGISARLSRYASVLSPLLAALRSISLRRFLSDCLVAPLVMRAQIFSSVFLAHLPEVRQRLLRSERGRTPEAYALFYLAATAVIALLFTCIITSILVRVRGFAPARAIAGGGVIGVLVWIGLFALTVLVIPGIRASKRAERIDQHILSALRELRLLITAGHPAHDALLSLAQARYGELSVDAEVLVRDLESNVPLEEALRAASERNPSEAFGRLLTLVQGALTSGASLTRSLDGAITSEESRQVARIQSYAKELNLWSLIYMLFAVAIPTIGAVMLVVLSSFVGTGGMSYSAMLAGCFLVQLMIIGFIKTRRPLGI